MDPDDKRLPMAIRILMAVTTSFVISLTTFWCVFLQYQKAHSHVSFEDALWDFLNHDNFASTRWACFLSGVIALPIGFISGISMDKRKHPLPRALLANLLTALFAILVAVIMASIYLFSLEHH